MTSQWDSWSQSYVYPLFIPFGLVSEVILSIIIQFYILHLQFQHRQDSWPPMFVTVMGYGLVALCLPLWLCDSLRQPSETMWWL